MAKIDHSRFRRRKVYEAEIPAELRQDRPAGPSKATLRAQAAQAVAQYRKPISKAPAASPGPSPRRARSEPPVYTKASSEPRDLRIECQCGHSATLHAAPAALIGRRLRCSKCGEEPFPF